METLIDPEDVNLMATLDGQNKIELVYTDQSKLNSKKKLAFTMMSAKGVTDNFDANTQVPYSEFVRNPSKGFNKTKFFPTKEMLAK